MTIDEVLQLVWLYRKAQAPAAMAIRLSDLRAALETLAAPAAPQEQITRMAAFAAELKADPVRAQAFFQSAGIIDEQGELTAEYGGAKQAEPVAWRIFDGEGGYDYSDDAPSEEQIKWSARWSRRHEPLYLHPPAAEMQRLRDELMVMQNENALLRDALTALCAVADDREEGNYDTVPIHCIRSIARRALGGGE